ncbi:hypothetical protein B7L09_03275 [Pseudomonas mandelii]|jgi:hypothetical protein|nr:hypothetical protein B7L09_03275 [Pseudomonas mandelii]
MAETHECLLDGADWMFRTKGARKRDFTEGKQGGEALEMTRSVLEKDTAEQPAAGISRLSDIRKRDLRRIAETEWTRAD